MNKLTTQAEPPRADDVPLAKDADRAVGSSAWLGGIISKTKEILGYGTNDGSDNREDDYPYWLFIPALIGAMVGLGLL